MVACVRVAMVAVVVQIGLLTGCTSSDHRRSGGDSTVAGKPGTVAVAAANPVTGKFLWRVPTKGDFQIFSGMVLAGQTLYGQWAECIDRHNTGVAAIDVATGHVRWRTASIYRGEESPDNVPLSALGGVYVAMGSAQNATTILGIDVASGKLRWTRAIAGQQAYGAALDRAVLAVITRPANGPGGTVTGVDRATGRVLWTQQLAAGASQWTSVAADDDHIFASYITDSDPSLEPSHTIALAARTGQTVWEHDGGRTHPGRPGEHVVALEETKGVVGVDADTGKQRWQRTDVIYLGDRVDTADGRVVLAGSNRGGIRSGIRSGIKVVDIATGKDLWTKSANVADDVIVTRANGIVLREDRTRHSTLYNAATGAAIGTPAQLPEETDQQAVPMQIDADGRVIVARGCPGRG